MSTPNFELNAPVPRPVADPVTTIRRWSAGPPHIAAPLVQSEDVTFTYWIAASSAASAGPVGSLLRQVGPAFDAVIAHNVASIEGWNAKGNGATLLKNRARARSSTLYTEVTGVLYDVVVRRTSTWEHEAYASVAEGLQELLQRGIQGLGLVCSLHEVDSCITQLTTSSRPLFRPTDAVAAARYVIRFADGAYNRGVGLQNGFPADLSEATRYELEEAQQRLEDLLEAEIVDVRTIAEAPEYDPLVVQADISTAATPA